MNVFVIRSPYCYLNAIELKRKYDLEDDACILVIAYSAADSVDMEHFGRIVDSDEWHRIEYIPQNVSAAQKKYSSQKTRKFRFPGEKIFFLRKYVFQINRSLPEKKDVEKVVVQNIDDYVFLHIANQLEPDYLYCLDEGPKSLWTTELRKHSYGRNWIEQAGISFKRLAMSLFFGYKVAPLKNTIFFSCYDLAHGPTESLVRNSYDFLRAKAARLQPQEELIYFIGSSISEVGVVSEEYYLHSLARVKKDYPNQKMVYIAHRADDENKLKNIEENLGIPVVVFHIPFELQVAITGPVPRKIISFYSSVLVNMHTMFRGVVDVVSYRLPERKIAKRYRDEVNTVYDYFLEVREEYFIIKYLE